MSQETPIDVAPAAEQAPVAVAAPPQPAPAPANDSFLGIPMSTLKYALLASLLYVIISSPLMYKLTGKLIPAYDAANGCGSHIGLGVHAVVFGALVYVFTRFDCNGKLLSLNEQLYLCVTAAVLYALIGYVMRYFCANATASDRYIYRVNLESGTDSKAIVPLLGGGLAFFISSLLLKALYDNMRPQRSEYAYAQFEQY